jgi:hypothetical protein
MRRTQNEVTAAPPSDTNADQQAAMDATFQSVLQAFAELSEAQQALLAQIVSKPARTSDTPSQ